MLEWARAVVIATVIASGCIAACAPSRPPPAGDELATGSSGRPSLGTGVAANTGCGSSGACECVDVPLYADAPNVYFVLDRSGSMVADDKWEHVRTTVARVMRDVGPRAAFGATVFPGFSGNSCGPSAEIMTVRPGDPPSSTDGPTTSYLLNATNIAPQGDTPTAGTLRDVLARVEAVPGKTFIVLATDGGPNCGVEPTCPLSECIENIEDQPGCPTDGPRNCCTRPGQCLDARATADAVTALSGKGFPVYVIGIPGSAAYASLLDRLATLGGTALPGTPSYFRADDAAEAQLLATLRKVLAKIVATCTFSLKETPADPGLVNVYLDDVVEPKDPLNGWTIDGTTVTLVGEACARVTNGDVLGVRIVAGCPSVVR